jgi:diguanylate cyclase (GGDEF)-like protein/PAS domain S-box-containing protein
MIGGGVEIFERSASAEGTFAFNQIYFSQLFDVLPDGIFFADTEGRILCWNREAEKITGYSSAEVVGRLYNSCFFDQIDGGGKRLSDGHCLLDKAIRTRQIQSKRIYFRHKDRRNVAVAMQAVPLMNELKNIAGVVGILHDATVASELENVYGQLRDLLAKDALTDAVSREQIDVTTAAQLELLKRYGIPFSIILLSIDRLKQIKKSSDESAAAKLQILIANLLQRQCRNIDVIGRYKEGIFLIVLRQQKIADALQTADRLKSAVSIYDHEDIYQRNISVSLGVSEASIDDSQADLLKRAAISLRNAKKAGGNKVEFLDPAFLQPVATG